MATRSPHALTFCDVSNFYCAKGGGIRTYHRAKIDWFSRQRTHRYALISPGPRFRVTRHSEAVTLVEVYGPTTGGGAEGYRVMADYRRLRAVVSELQPDVLEAGDPWVSGPCALMLRRCGHRVGLLTSFFHTDVIGAYLEPWMGRRRLPARVRASLQTTVSRWFGKMQARFDWTLVSSPFMQERLAALGVHRVLVTPFGGDPALLAAAPRPATAGRPVRLIYAGRLQPEKGIDQVLDVLPGFIDESGVEFTIAGAGPLASRVAGLTHPGVRYVGYVEDPAALHVLFREHDVLVTPSATETFGLTALEAMADGLVVVGADRGGMGDLMRQSASPFMFRSGDRADLLRAIQAALSADRRDAAARGRAVAERHGTWDDAIARQVSVYEATHREAAAGWTRAPGPEVPPLERADRACTGVTSGRINTPETST